MEVFPVYDPLTIESRSGAYHVSFSEDLIDKDLLAISQNSFILVDAKVADIYAKPLAEVLANPNTIVIEAIEKNKSIENILSIIRLLIDRKIRRNNILVAIGGGVIQDITCFIASILLRGVEWRFFPTTLLSQSDSCIGSKSSINVDSFKNILGTFNPPSQVCICPKFLDSLDIKELQSGIGEILKVHAIAGKNTFDAITKDFDNLIPDRQILLSYIRSSLLIKQKYIELDEFDKGVRNIFNYGHSFGHAIETATNYAVPHGIAVSMGMDMANHIAAMRNLLPDEHCNRMSIVLRKNYDDFKNATIPMDKFLEALMKDKKNSSTELTLIFAVGSEAEITRVSIPPDELFIKQCKQFFEKLK